jgi:hypothetical protein
MPDAVVVNFVLRFGQLEVSLTGASEAAPVIVEIEYSLVLVCSTCHVAHRHLEPAVGAAGQGQER